MSEMELAKVIKEQSVRATDRLREQFAPLDKWVRTVAKNQPVLLLAGAVTLGYVLARLSRHR